MKLPTYDGPQVKQGAASGTMHSGFATAQQMGAGVGQALGNVGNVMAQHASKMKAEDDQARIKAALNEFRTGLNARTYLDEDAYYNRKGIEAYDSFGGALDEFNKLKETVGSNLKSPDQRKLFDEAATGYITNEHGQMARYASAERNKWMNDQDQAVITQAAQDGALRYLDNGKYAAQMTKAVDAMAGRNGWSPEVVEGKKQEALSTMHVEALENIFAKSPQVAKDYFETHKDAISPTLHDRILTQIKNSDNAVWVEEKAAAIRVAGGSRTERLAAVNDLTEDPDQRKMLRNQVAQDLTQERYAEQEAQLEAYDLAFNAIVDPTGNGMSLTAFQAGNPEAWDRLSPSQKSGIINAAKEPAKSTQTDIMEYNLVYGMIASEDKEAAREHILNNMDRFTIADAKTLINLTYEKPKATSATDKDPLNSEARTQFGDWLEATIGPEPSTSSEKKRMEYNQRRNILLGMYVNKLAPDMSFQDRRVVLDEFTRELLVKNRKLLPDKTESIYSLPIEKLNSIQSQLDDLGVDMTPEEVAFAVESGVDLGDMRYAMAAESLRKAGLPVTLRYILLLDEASRELPAE